MISKRDEHFQDFLLMRGVENPCKQCGGIGVRVYGSTAMWRSGIGGQMVCSGVCDKCWGSGDADKPWTDLRKVDSLYEENKRLMKELDQLRKK